MIDTYVALTEQRSAYQPEGQLINTAENKEYISSLAGIERALATDRILEAKAILCDNSQNLTVDLNGIQGIIEKKEASVGSYSDGQIRDIAIITRVGKPVCFKALRIEKDIITGKPIVYLSRKAAQEECIEKHLMQMSCGDIIDTKITHMESFGCFCDIGCGVISLLPIDCISISRISHPSDRYSVNQYLKAIIKTIDYNTKKISLTHKELLGTWEENAALFQVGQTTTGIVRSVEPYGIFIELSPNLAGLAEYKDDIEDGQQAVVYIKSIIPERMKIKLVLIDKVYAEASENEKQRTPVYYIDDTHINYWQYSPQSCSRVIETNFN